MRCRFSSSSLSRTGVASCVVQCRVCVDYMLMWTTGAHTHTATQVHFSVVDLELHARYTPGQGESVFERDQKVAQRTQVMPPFPEDRFLCSFGHIFAGGYSAGYFSYK